MSPKLHLFIAPDGNDVWRGTAAAPTSDGTNGPLASLSGARDAVRRHRNGALRAGRTPAAVIIEVADGFYELGQTLTFAPEDSGSPEFPVCFRAADGASPIVSGGRLFRAQIETEHNGRRTWIVDLPDVAAGAWNFTRLYVNGAARERTRLPAEGFYKFTDIAGCEDSGDNWCNGPDRANFRAGDIRRWHNWQDAELISYQLWFDTHHRFKNIDEESGTVEFHARSLGSLRDERGDFARYFVENVFEALDTPGQWYLDRTLGRLHYLPLPGEHLETTEFIAPQLECLVRIEASHLHFENLTFSHQHWQLPLTVPGYIQAAWGVPGAIILEGARHCVFYGCTISQVNGYGIEILAGSEENIVAATTMCDAGAGGIKVGHEQLDPHQGRVGEGFDCDCDAIATTIVDCTVRDCGSLFPSAIGIWVGNSGWNRLLHNSIFNCNYTGISCGWTWGYKPTRTVANRIEYNHIHHVNHREILSDNGGIYTLGQQPGTVLRGNVVHDIACYEYGGWGIYPDEGSSEMLVEQNLVQGTKRASYAVHYGRDNLVQNNIFALSLSEHLHQERREPHRSTLMRRNIIVGANGAFNGKWEAPFFTSADNLFWSNNGTPLTFDGAPLAQLQEAGQQAGTTVADPLFADAAGGNFALRDDSPALQTGFAPFDWRAAGQRLKEHKPRSYREYSEMYPLAPHDAPVVRTRFALMTPLREISNGAIAEFSVTLTNVGRSRGAGRINFSTGPGGLIGSPDLEEMDFDLEPGETKTERISAEVRDATRTFWLESEPSGGGAVPAREAVILHRRWNAPMLTGIAEPNDIPAALADVPARLIQRGARVVAKVKIASSEEGLILAASGLGGELRSNLEKPWQGMCLEVIARPEPHAESALSPIGQQLFLVPLEGGETVAALRMDENSRAVEEPRMRAALIHLAQGKVIAAIIPWALLGFDAAPAEFSFEIVVDSVDPDAGGIVQTTAFEIVSESTVNIPGRVVVTGS